MKTPKRRTTLLASIIIAVPGVTVAADKYEYALFKVTALGDLADWAWGTNESGTVVGSSFLDNGSVFHPYHWSEYAVLDLGTLGGALGEAWDINNAGTVIGWADNPQGEIRAFIWNQTSGLQDLGTLGGPQASARGINDVGQVVGSANINSEGRSHAFLWQNNEMLDLGSLSGELFSRAWDINEGGIIIGEADNGSTTRPVMWKDDQIIDLGSLGDGTHRGVAFGINDLEQVVGESFNDSNNNKPFLWVNGKMLSLVKNSGYGDGFARAINNQTHVVGLTSRNGNNLGFIWTPEKGLRILDTLIPPRSGVRLASATEITENGIISANALNSNGFFARWAYLLTPVTPELTLSDPVPGVVGQKNTWTITNAIPNSKVTLTYSLKGGGTVVPGCDKLAAVLQIDKPKVIKTVTADADGEATFRIFVPTAAANLGPILLQAVSLGECRESQLTTHQFN